MGYLAREPFARRGWGHDGKTWLLLVNAEQDKEQTFEIEFARPISSATVDLGEPACWPRDKRLTARLPRLGVALLTPAFL